MVASESDSSQQYYIGQGEGVVFRKLLIKKCTDVPSVLFSFLESTLRCRPRVTESEIK